MSAPRVSLAYPRLWRPNTVPTFQVELDRAHPLARGLALSIVPGSTRGSVDFVRGIAPVVTGSPSVANTPIGRGLLPNGGILGYPFAAAPVVFSYEVYVQAYASLAGAESILAFNQAVDATSGTFDREVAGDSGNNYILVTFPGGKSSEGGTHFQNSQIVHLVFTNDGTNVAIYVNGALSATTALGAAYGGYSSPVYLVIGNSQSAKQGWRGQIMLVNMASVVWTAGEVAARYAEPFGMFRPIVRRQYFVASAGGTSFTATPGVGTITLTGLQPTVSAAAALAPGVGSVVFTGLQPTVSVGSNFTATPGVGSIVITGQAPAVAASTVITPGAGSVIFTGQAPTVTASAALTPGSGTITFTGQQPTVSAGGNVTLTPGTGSIVFTGQAPLVAAGVAVSPGVGAIIYTGHAPTVAASTNFTATPGTGSIVFTGMAPVVAPSGINLTPGTGRIIFTGHAPTGGFTPVVTGVTLPIGRPVAQEYMPDEVAHRRQLARTVNLAMSGKTNTTLFVTLTPSAATTPVVDSRISLQTCVTLHPQTANAAAALSTTYSVCAAGVATINHANNGQTDRTFTMGIHG